MLPAQILVYRLLVLASYSVRKPAKSVFDPNPLISSPTLIYSFDFVGLVVNFHIVIVARICCRYRRQRNGNLVGDFCIVTDLGNFAKTRETNKMSLCIWRFDYYRFFKMNCS